MRRRATLAEVETADRALAAFAATMQFSPMGNEHASLWRDYLIDIFKKERMRWKEHEDVGIAQISIRGKNVSYGFDERLTPLYFVLSFRKDGMFHCDTRTATKRRWIEGNRQLSSCTEFHPPENLDASKDYEAIMKSLGNFMRDNFPTSTANKFYRMFKVFSKSQEFIAAQPKPKAP